MQGYRTLLSALLGLLVALGAMFGIIPTDAEALPAWAKAILALVPFISTVVFRAKARGPMAPGVLSPPRSPDGDGDMSTQGKSTGWAG